MKTAPVSQFMDGKHVTKGLQCTACHTAMPPKGAPETKTCLSCHKNTYTAMAEVTAKVSPNPHSSHEGEIPCVDCHKGHEPFVYGCGKAGCHSEYSSNRFK
ncbi:MAG: cytochrome c3 family protein [Chloroflexi bacterium]|nr:cytochrome c3 family protein [Chloroflexota bacterium]